MTKIATSMAATAESVRVAGALSEIVGERYRVLERLGGGGMGEVYEVEHVRLERRFAMKVLRPELAASTELVLRFDREARAVAKLHSDYVVGIVDSGSLVDGRPYFVMERLLGQDLRRLLASAPQLPVERAVNLAIDVCLGLHVAHGAGLVHRDLKPENLFITRTDDGRDRCKVLDFGVVKLAEQEQTQPGALLGTARYMAPEQVTSGADVGPSADLFALGVILYRCLSGEHPFAADSLERVLFRIMNDTPRRLTELAPHVPVALSELVVSAMARAPSQRPASALALAKALAAFADERRALDGATSWQLDTRAPGEGAISSRDDTQPTSSLARAVPPLPSAKVSRRARFPLLAGALLLLLVPLTLLVDRWSLRRTGSASAELPSARTRTEPAFERPTLVTTAPPMAGDVAASESGPASPTVSAPHTTPVVALHRKAPSRAASPSPSPSPSSSSPPAAAPPPAASAGRPSVTWFDPRNPYGK